MSQEEFTDMIVSLGVCDEYFGQRELGMYFSLSKQTYVNEIAEEPWHLRMLFVEFVEVLSRTAEKIPYETLKTKLVGLEQDKGKNEEEILKLNIHEEISENSSNDEN